MEASCIDYKDTGFFSQTVIDYLEDKPELRPFYSYRPDMEGFRQILKDERVTADRGLLAEVLLEQYANIADTVRFPLQGVRGQISLLKESGTYTVTTGHQLNIFAGPLYFIYKIVTAIKLARQ
ncbi:MAG TPA: bacillithiol biosynthesis BshC, partial [Mucilaginibacter sp.]|nr:bacillithiol biosynthesis BshC [Mucilaginibacter sp.]